MFKKIARKTGADNNYSNDINSNNMGNKKIIITVTAATSTTI